MDFQGLEVPIEIDARYSPRNGTELFRGLARRSKDSRINSRQDSPHLCAGGSLTNFDTSTKLSQKRPTKRSRLRSVENLCCH